MTNELPMPLRFKSYAEIINITEYTDNGHGSPQFAISGLVSER